MSDSDITTGSVASTALLLLDSVPDAVSGAMATYAEMARNKINAILGTSLSTSGISPTYQTPMIDLTAAFALGKMANVGVDYNWSLGEFSVSKGASSSPEFQQVKFLMDDFNMCMKGIGRGASWCKSNG